MALYPKFPVVSLEENPVKDFFDKSRAYMTQTNIFKSDLSRTLFDSSKIMSVIPVRKLDIPEIEKVEDSQQGFDAINVYLSDEKLFYRQLKIDLENTNSTVFSLLEPKNPEILPIDSEEVYNINSETVVNHFNQMAIYVGQLQRVIETL